MRLRSGTSSFATPDVPGWSCGGAGFVAVDPNLGVGITDYGWRSQAAQAQRTDQPC